MTPEKAREQFKRTIRIAGAYAATAILLLFIFVVTAPNSTDSGWDAFGFVICLMWALPFVLMLTAWVYTEVTKAYDRVYREREDSE